MIICWMDQMNETRTWQFWGWNNVRKEGIKSNNCSYYVPIFENSTKDYLGPRWAAQGSLMVFLVILLHDVVWIVSSIELFSILGHKLSKSIMTFWQSQL